MRITSSQVAMTATHESSVSVVRSERLAVEATALRSEGPDESRENDRVHGDDRHGHHRRHRHGQEGAVEGSDRGVSNAFERLAVELMSIFRRGEDHAATGGHVALLGEAAATAEAGRPLGPRREEDRIGHRGERSAVPQRWNVVYDRHEERRVFESTAFAASGTVTTADGRTIDFATAFAQVRSEVSSSDLHLEIRGLNPTGGGLPKPATPDPVLPPLGGSAASAADGAQDVSTASAADEVAVAPVAAPDASTPANRTARLLLGSGYLSIFAPALGAGTSAEAPVPEATAPAEAAPAEEAPPLPPAPKEPSDNSIRHVDAQWLGGVSGDAFRDLALLDSDHNGWIDEGDPAWQLLRVVQASQDAAPEAGKTLADAGVGAINVESVATPSSVPAAQGGHLAATGVYLKENGEVGKVQQIDFIA